MYYYFAPTREIGLAAGRGSAATHILRRQDHVECGAHNAAEARAAPDAVKVPATAAQTVPPHSFRRACRQVMAGAGGGMAAVQSSHKQARSKPRQQRLAAERVAQLTSSAAGWLICTMQVTTVGCHATGGGI